MKQVYVIDFGDKVKVGITDDIGRRIYQIQTAAGERAKRFFMVDGDSSLERKIQHNLLQYRIVGEFFRCDFVLACTVLGRLSGNTFHEKMVRFPDAEHSRTIWSPAKSNAEYYRKRRETIGQFSVPLSREKLNALTEKLKREGKTKTQWLSEKVDEELRDKK